MQVFDQIEPNQGMPLALALGFFDGVHCAHVRVLQAVTKGRACLDWIPAALTFRLSERGMPNKPNLRTIFTEEQRNERIARLGIERIYQPEFDAIAQMEPNAFLCLLRDELRVKQLSCGYDYTFGKNAAGGVELLQRFCEENGIVLCLLPPVSVDGGIVSSTAIRELLADGNIPAAERLLDAPYEIVGRIQPGKSIGHTLGLPTINQSFAPTQAVPGFGVYRSVTEIDGGCWDSITNIGVKPTIPGKREPLAETHMIGATGNYYGKTARVRLIDRMRSERKFSNLEALKQQIRQDIANR